MIVMCTTIYSFNELTSVTAPSGLSNEENDFSSIFAENAFASFLES